MIRAGTFKCWLFGHKFIHHFDDEFTGITHYWKEQKRDYCCRCGVTKQELREQHERQKPV